MGCESCITKKTSKIQIIIIGLRQSGKTAIFFKLTDHPHFTNPVPTVHPNSQIIQYRNRNITLIDLPPQIPTPKVANLKGLIFVVDSSDKNRLEEAKTIFNRTLNEKNVPILLMLTKNDKAVVNQKEIEDYFQLKKLNREVRLQFCSGYSGDGVYEGFSEFFNTIVKNL